MNARTLKEIYSGKHVFVTGHTGFKGSWLTLFLETLGAKVFGYSLEAPTNPNHYSHLSVACQSTIADIRSAERLQAALFASNAEIVFHLAAQPLVRASYKDPVETYTTNVIGTLNVLEACRLSKSVKAIVNVTSDKCYENKEWEWGYRENDPMGGHDPYSSSKGCAEILAASYRRSFFDDGRILLASVRAGNVIGGGDWAHDRLIPDIVRATRSGTATAIRNPSSVRPWQHVLDPLLGYLLLGAELLQQKKDFATGWNFGPTVSGSKSVKEVANMFSARWPRATFEFHQATGGHPHEAGLLRLDITKAVTQLGWRPLLDLETTIQWTADWYRQFCESGEVLSVQQLNEFMERIA